MTTQDLYRILGKVWANTAFFLSEEKLPKLTNQLKGKRKKLISEALGSWLIAYRAAKSDEEREKVLEAVLKRTKPQLISKLLDIEICDMNHPAPRATETPNVFDAGIVEELKNPVWANTADYHFGGGHACLILSRSKDEWYIYDTRDGTEMSAKTKIEILGIGSYTEAGAFRPAKPTELYRYLAEKDYCAIAHRIVDLPYYKTGYNIDKGNPNKSVFNIFNKDMFQSFDFTPMRSGQYKHRELAEKTFDAINKYIFTNELIAARMVTHLRKLAEDAFFPRHDIYMIIGPTRNGKSFTMENVIRDFIVGNENWLKMKLHELQRNFNSEQRYKRVLYFEETQNYGDVKWIDTELKDKSATKDVNIEPKGVDRIKTFANYTPIIVSNETKPYFINMSDGRTNILFTQKDKDYTIRELETWENIGACKEVAMLMLEKYDRPDILDSKSGLFKDYERERRVSALSYLDFNIYLGRVGTEIITLNDEIKNMIEMNSCKSYPLSDEQIALAESWNSEFYNAVELLPSIRIEDKCVCVDNEDLCSLRSAYAIKNRAFREKEQARLGGCPF